MSNDLKKELSQIIPSECDIETNTSVSCFERLL